MAMQTRARSGAFTAAHPHGSVPGVVSPSNSNNHISNSSNTSNSSDINGGGDRHITSVHHQPIQAPLAEVSYALKPPRPLPPLPLAPGSLSNCNGNDSSSGSSKSSNSRASLPPTPSSLPHSPFTTSTTITTNPFSSSSYTSTTSASSASTLSVRQEAISSPAAASPPTAISSSPLPFPSPRSGDISPNSRTVYHNSRNSPSPKTVVSPSSSSTTGLYLNSSPPPLPSTATTTTTTTLSTTPGSSGIPKPRVAPKSNALAALGSCSTPSSSFHSSPPHPLTSAPASASAATGFPIGRSRHGEYQQSRTDNHSHEAVEESALQARTGTAATPMTRSSRGVSATTSALSSMWETKTADVGGSAQRRDIIDGSTPSSAFSSVSSSSSSSLFSSSSSTASSRRFTGGSMIDFDLQGSRSRPTANSSMTSSIHASHVNNNPLYTNNNSSNSTNNRHAEASSNNRIRSLSSSTHAAPAIVTTATAASGTATTPGPLSFGGGVAMARGRSQGSPAPTRGYSKSVSAPIAFISHEVSAAALSGKYLSSGHHASGTPVSSSGSSRAFAPSNTINNNATAGASAKSLPSSLPPPPSASLIPSSSSSSSSASSVSSSPSSSLGQLSAAAVQSNTLSNVASSVDLVGRRLREEQLQSRVKAAREFIETTIGQLLPHADLHESLKDGVILCKLANRLRPGTVEQISLKNLPFVKMENISNFLNAAKKLGVQSSDLFQTVDLYEGKDMVQGAANTSASKRPGPTPLVAPDLGQAPKTSRAAAPAPASPSPSAQPLMRMRSKTAHAPSIASSTPVIRPSNSSYYAAQIRKLEEDSIRYSTGIEHLQKMGLPIVPPVVLPSSAPPPPQLLPTPTPSSSSSSSTKERHLSAPVPPKAQLREKASRRPSLDDIVAGVESSLILDNEVAASTTAMTSSRTATILEDDEDEMVFGSSASRLLQQQQSPPPQQLKARFPRSTSGSALIPEPSSSLGIHGAALDMAGGGAGVGARRKKKSISLDPQAANAILQTKRSVYRDGLASPVSPGLVASGSYGALSTSTMGPDGMALKQHGWFASEKVDLTSIMMGSPSTSRSTTPVQGLRKSANSTEPLREKLDLEEGGRVTATFQLGNCIGRGQFGAVYKALNLGTGQMVAVKRIKVDGLQDTEMDMLMQEVELLKTLSHPSIVKYEGFIKTFGYLNIILEFVENGSLLTTLKAFGTFPEKLVVAYVVKILEGLVYLHGKEVVHCDLKAANILTTKNGNVKLSDFGVSLNMKVKESDFGAVAGTPNWMAPEVIELKGASPASDIWSLGCTIIEMLTGRPPYADLLAMTTLFRIVEDDRPPLPNNISADLLDFLCQCFQKDPTLRPSASMLSRHRWIVRNFSGRELKPMDSLPYIKRKSLEPREQGAVAAATALEREEQPKQKQQQQPMAKRALTPAGLSSGALPMAGATIAHPNGLARSSSRRGSVDSASTPMYSSATAPAAVQLPDKYDALGYDNPTRRMHQFVKSSFAKPVECRFCHDSVKSRAVICQDCSLVFHKKCQPYVGDTCFPNVLSYFQQVPTPAQSVPNLKMAASNMQQANDGSRPSSRASMNNNNNTRERARSVTPSHKYRGSGEDPYYGRSTPVAADQYPPQVGRPSSRQSNHHPSSGSPTSPTLAGLKNFIAGSRRFSFGNKKQQQQGGPSVEPHSAIATAAAAATQTAFGHGYMASLPTPPTSLSSSTSHGFAPLSPGSAAEQQHHQRPPRPASQPAVPITRGSGGRHRREYFVGLVDRDDEDELAESSLGKGMPPSGVFRLGHGSTPRPSAMQLFSTSAPSSQMSLSSHYGGRRIKHSSSSTTLKGVRDEDEQVEEEGEEGREEEEEEEEDAVTAMTGRFHAGRRIKSNNHQCDDLEEDDLDALLVPSAVAAAVSAASNASPRFKGASSRASAQLGHGASSPPSNHHVGEARPSVHYRHQHGGPHGPIGHDINSSSKTSTPATTTTKTPTSPGVGKRQNGYHSSGSSTAAMTSSYSSLSNNSSPASSLGSVAALLEEEDRMLMLSMMTRDQATGLTSGSGAQLSKNSASGHVAAGYSHGTPSNHVGIRTMLNRFNQHGATNGTDSYQRPLHPLQTLHDVDEGPQQHYFGSRPQQQQYLQDLDMDLTRRELPSPPEVHVSTPGGHRQTALGLSFSSKQVQEAFDMAAAHEQAALALNAPGTPVPTSSANAGPVPGRPRRNSRVYRREL
ncbi:hypothetical protein BGZ73_005567 [Actinomortierella ambigua]|nr:hypothetical protein BGZ73_005567 [Actinomortierella ambigua]